MLPRGSQLDDSTAEVRCNSAHEGLRLLARGHTDKEIAAQFYISPPTVHNPVSRASARRPASAGEDHRRGSTSKTGIVSTVRPTPAASGTFSRAPDELRSRSGVT